MTVRDDATAALARVDALHTALTQIVLEGGDLGGSPRRSRGCSTSACWSPRPTAASAPPALERRGPGGARASAGSSTRPAGSGSSGSSDDGAPPLGAGEVRSLRVAAGGADLARLVCVRPDAPITADDVHALERAAAVAALLITRQRRSTAVENKYQGDFLRDLFFRGARRGAVRRRARRGFGWDLARPVVVVVAELDPPPRDETPVSREQRRPGRSGSPRPGGRSSRPSSRASRASTSPPRWSPCCPPPADGDGRAGPATTSYAARSPRWPATRAAAAAVLGRGQPGGPARRAARRPTPRPGGRWRSAGGCTAPARRRSSTSSACTG